MVGNIIKLESFKYDFIYSNIMPFKMEQLIGLGITIMIIGFIIVFFGTLLSSKESTSKTKVAVGGFIGFIPFGFGNDKNLVWFVSILSLALFLVWLLFGFRFLK